MADGTEEALRGYHSHLCRGCEIEWECEEEDCELETQTLCLNCYDRFHPDESLAKWRPSHG